MKILLLSLCTILLGNCTLAHPTKDEINQSILEMRLLVENAQVKKEKPFFPFLEWAEHKGIWPSYVKQYFHGPPDLALFRQLFGVFDNNMFATAIVMEFMIEFSKYGDLKDDSLSGIPAGLAAIKEHRDKNVPFNNSLMTFWPQEYNDTTKSWMSAPQNLLGLLKSIDYIYMPLNWTYAELEKLGLKDVESIVKHLLSTRDNLTLVFHVPPDFDDTFLNIGLGSVLHEMKHLFSNYTDVWSSHNTNLTSVFDALKRYAYRPFSGDQRVNTIDPRSYLYLRKWLEQEKNAGNDVALVPTWAQDTDEVRTWYDKGVMMPFNVNNIDVTVCANFMFSVTNGIINGLFAPSVLDDPEIMQIYNDTSRMIAFQIQTNFSDRPDLALTYYPSVIEFYWFVARTYNRLEETLQRTGTLPHKLMEQVYTDFKAALRTYVSPRIVAQGKNGTTYGWDTVYYDDFLGGGDTDYENRSVNNAEDRIFTTGIALNALMTIWTTQEQHSMKVMWDKDTPEGMKTLVHNIVTWLYYESVDSQFKPWNAFFTGSYRGLTTSPGSYPYNRVELFNGTRVPSIRDVSRNTNKFIFGVEGTIPEVTYEAMIKKEHSPTVFHGYNAQKFYFPYWSSDSYTYITAMVGMAKYVLTMPNDTVTSVTDAY